MPLNNISVDTRVRYFIEQSKSAFLLGGTDPKGRCSAQVLDPFLFRIYCRHARFKRVLGIWCNTGGSITRITGSKKV